MVGILTYKDRCVTVASLKGNTIGILHYLDEKDFNKVMRLNTRYSEDPRPEWNRHSTIFIGVSTYYSKKNLEYEFPRQLHKYEKSLRELKGKDIVLFGSGRTEFPFFCGALDYLEDMMQDKNSIHLKYKFEGYPREVQKIEFRDEVNRLVNQGKI